MALKKIKGCSSSTDDMPVGTRSLIRSAVDISGAIGRRGDASNKYSGLPHYILREVAALLDLQGHENVLRLLDIFQIKGSKKVVLSFAFEEGGDLGKLLHKVRHINQKAASVRSKLKYQGLPPFVVCQLGGQLLRGI